MATMRCGEDEAMQILVNQSQAQNVKLRDIVTEVVQNTTRHLPGADS